MTEIRPLPVSNWRTRVQLHAHGSVHEEDVLVHVELAISDVSQAPSDERANDQSDTLDVSGRSTYTKHECHALHSRWQSTTGCYEEVVPVASTIRTPESLG